MASTMADRMRTERVCRSAPNAVLISMGITSPDLAAALAAGLGLSVGLSGGVDRLAVADADQVAPEGCTLRP